MYEACTNTKSFRFGACLTGEFPYDIRQMAHILGQKRRMSSLDLPVGEYRLAFRQFTNIRLTLSNGGCTIGETPYLRSCIAFKFSIPPHASLARDMRRKRVVPEDRLI